MLKAVLFQNKQNIFLTFQFAQFNQPGDNRQNFIKTKCLSQKPQILMGNQLCGPRLLNGQVELKQKNLIVKCNKDQLKYSKTTKDVPSINGYVEIYQTKPMETLVYTGEMKDSKFNGFGKLYQANKLIYEGEFKEGLFEGWGITEEYTGQFREGKYDGYGIYMEYQDQKKEIITSYYEGYFFDGVFSGTGLEIKQVSLPVKLIEQIQQQEGMVEYLYSNIEHGMQIAKKYGAKEVYIGQFTNGFRNGIGRFFKDGKEYSGEFKYGKNNIKATNLEIASGKKASGGCFSVQKTKVK